MTTATQQRAQIAAYLEQFDFRRLFVEELGWNRYRESLAVDVNATTYTLRGVAEKKGVVVLVCDPDDHGGIPNYVTRKQIDDQVTRSIREHLIIFVDAQQTHQSWLWVRRKPGQRTAYRGEEYYRGHSGERLIQKLQQIAIDMADEEALSLIDVMLRLEKGFDVERVTKKFYERFQIEHRRFEQTITGIADEEGRRWYASLMLNRLMFVYFIQRKGFLDGDIRYLSHRLEMVQALGPDRFHSFYRGFLLHLFHDGLGKPPVDRKLAPELAALIGAVPYLNGGLFEVHKIEHDNRDIGIPDTAFERIFAFFNEWEWHLDTRPQASGNEINPDVLGYIFEKYINQKQMGAYYTKEDITGYIGRNTIVPFLFDRAKADNLDAFAPEGEVWRLLRDDPDRYIYEAVRRGVDEPLPEDIAAGIRDVSRRAGWNRPAPTPFALPTETWREHIARRTRCLELRERLASGGVTEVNDLITYNLDIELLARDVIERCEDPRLLRALWNAISSVTVLDPTCGSGAFLFAALNILEPLYDACLTRMAAFVADYQRAGHLHSGQDFAGTLARVSAHTNHRYFVLKSIIINNLYGVDIMEEACEIAKLRLFLKLVAQVDAVDNLEPLPDIDFNIRAGNTLVGFTTLDAVRQAMTYDVSGHTRKLLLDVDDEAALARIEQRAAEIGRAYQHFQKLQSAFGIDAAVFRAAKDGLRHNLNVLREELDRYLAREYGISATNDLFALAPWRASHQPLHWFVQFYGIMHDRGGFDVIIGNPPWVEYRNVSGEYTISGFASQECNNLWAYVTERSLSLINEAGRCGLIVPMSLTCTERMAPVQDLLRERGTSWISNFESDSNPGQLFAGVKQNVSILLHERQGNAHQFTTRLFRFFSEARDYVFYYVTYVRPERRYVNFGFPKVSEPIEVQILDRLYSHAPLARQMVAVGGTPIYVHRIAHYYIKCFDFVPYFRSARDGLKKSEDYKEYTLQPPISTTVAAINSTAFYFYWQVFFDSFKAGKQCVEGFPYNQASNEIQSQLLMLGERLMADMRSKAKRLHARYAATGEVEYDQFFPRHSKPIIDVIDRVLARHYGFTDEELDFIINYDIKYRMGQETADESDREE